VESDFGAWTDPFPMIAGWVLAVGTTVIAIALIVAFVLRATADEGGPGDD